MTTLTDSQAAALDYIAARHGRSWRRTALVAVQTNSVDLYVRDEMISDLVKAVSILGPKGLAKYEPKPVESATAPARTEIHYVRSNY